MNKLKGHTINISAKDKVFPLTLEKLEIVLDSDKLADNAINYGKDLSDEEKLRKIGSAEEADISISFGHNEEKITEFVQSVAKEVNQEA
ncbi:MAG TPA: hypothetical protein DHM90_05275, partial [Clostridiaceae bacterium]|nr:hypothetical protein [Clostridiaceae bacterium]